MRDKGFTRWRHDVKKNRRLKKDKNEHYDNIKCACYTDRRIQNMLAETPARCSCWGCRNREPKREQIRMDVKFKEAFYED